MKRASLLIFVCLTFHAWPAPHFAGEPAETKALAIPDIGLFGTSEQGSRPTWIASDALDNSGAILDQLTTASRISVRGYLKAAQDARPACFQATEVFNLYVGGPDRSTFRKAVTTAGQIVVARVTGARTGFFAGTPGTLFSVEISEILRGEAHPSTHFFFWPVGRLDLLNGCIEKLDGRVLASPRIGDAVLLLATDTYSVADAFLHLQKASDLIILGSDGNAVFQEAIDKSHEGQYVARHTWQGVLDQIRIWVGSERPSGAGLR